MKFSDRIGKTKPKEIIQYDSMDSDLKNSLWNLFLIDVAEKMLSADYNRDSLYSSTWETFAKTIWISFYKEPLDSMSMSKKAFIHNIRDRFFRWDYLQLYNFLDYIVSFESPVVIDVLINDANIIFERELAGYRFINQVLAPITNIYEIKSIEESLINTNEAKLKSVNTHLIEALRKLSDKTNPDYRNSIKESISAVESLCKIITNLPNADLGKTLKLISEKIPIHTALQQGFLKIYAYSSDSDGIRHGLSSESTVSIEDAQYMLISCSSFINYLIAKAVKAGIPIK